MAVVVTPVLDTKRLNLGPGNHYAEGWLNVDKYDLPHHKRRPDLMVDVLEGLPLPDGSFSKAYAGHVLEHLPYAQVPQVIAECWRVLAPGGSLAVVGPCIELAIRTGQPRWLLRDIIANPTPEMPGLGHEWTPTALLTLIAVQRGIGLPVTELVSVEEITPPMWPNPSLAPWQCAILATKP
jgi:SAM-dependent methyltransferase